MAIARLLVPSVALLAAVLPGCGWFEARPPEGASDDSTASSTSQ